MQYKVPQNIDLEDKIVGPFTMVQFVYLLVGSALVYVLLTALTINYFSIALVSPIALLTIALTFVKVQDQPFSKFLLNIVRFLTRPRRRLWDREGDPPTLIITKSKSSTFKPIKRSKVTKSELDRLASGLDTKGNQPNLKEIRDNLEAKQAAHGQTNPKTN